MLAKFPAGGKVFKLYSGDFLYTFAHVTVPTGCFNLYAGCKSSKCMLKNRNFKANIQISNNYIIWFCLLCQVQTRNITELADMLGHDSSDLAH